MAKLCQFDLELALVRPGTAREDIEDQAGPIKYAGVEPFLEITFLAWRQVVIEHDQLGLVLNHQLGHFLDLAAADKIAGVRHLAAATDMRKHVSAGRFDQFTKLAVGLVILIETERQVDDNGGLPARRPLKHAPTRCSGRSAGSTTRLASASHHYTAPKQMAATQRLPHRLDAARARKPERPTASAVLA